MKHGVRVRDIDHLLPKYPDGRGYDVELIYIGVDETIKRVERYQPENRPHQMNLEILKITAGYPCFDGGHSGYIYQLTLYVKSY